MPVPDKSTVAVRGIAYGAALALTIASITAPASMAQTEIAPDDVELRTVKDEAAPCLNVRDSPSYRSAIVGCVESGRTVTVTGVRRGWSYVIVDDELRGWAGTRFLEGGGAATPEPEPAPESATPEPEAEQPPAAALDSEPASDGNEPVMSVSFQEFVRISAERDRATEQLAAAMARVEELETELSNLSDLSNRVGDIATQLDQLTAERDQLATQLARAEAQQLYLQADLERTRSELMRLKGIPPRLVEIEPPAQPEPTPPPPAPEAAVEETTEEQPAVLPDFLGTAATEEVVATVRAWAYAWSEQRVDDYLSFYAEGFTPGDGSSRELWEAQRRARIEAPRSIEVTVGRINPIVAGDRATVSFVQSYESDTFRDVVDKTLLLERVDGYWRILEERAQ